MTADLQRQIEKAAEVLKSFGAREVYGGLCGNIARLVGYDAANALSAHINSQEVSQAISPAQGRLSNW